MDDSDEFDPVSRSAQVAAFLGDLRALADQRPVPTAELEALLTGEVRTVRRAGRRGVVLGAAAAVFVAGTGAAAATGDLPAPAQRVISTVVNRLTPFSIPSVPGHRVHSPTPVQMPPPAATSRAPAQAPNRTSHAPEPPAGDRSDEPAPRPSQPRPGPTVDDGGTARRGDTGSASGDTGSASGDTGSASGDATGGRSAGSEGSDTGAGSAGGAAGGSTGTRRPDDGSSAAGSAAPSGGGGTDD